MPLPFPAKYRSLAKVLADEGWTKQGEQSECSNVGHTRSNEAPLIVVTWWNRGKHAVILVSQEGQGDFVFTPVDTPRRLVSVIARRGKPKGARAEAVSKT